MLLVYLFQTTPPILEVPEEAEEDMDTRPKPRKWNGEDYDSDLDEDDKANSKCSDFTAHMRNTYSVSRILQMRWKKRS
ncbi:hypothetical protein RJT34_23021 [Clitoria ternatea]|uniref:Uncharacterized protein n=1 Tax=Clitoria ternatea TaxID=43366 RepID=A0AAN9FKV7_CLITE